MTEPLPILILAGSDQRPGPVGPGLSAEAMLSTHKGALPLGDGGCLAGELIRRLRSTGRFADPILVGPRDVYQDLVDCEISDVSGSLAETLQQVIRVIQGRFRPDAPVAITSCDILPTSREFVTLLEAGFDADLESHLWWQFVGAAPEQMGAGAWKPNYTMRIDHDDAARNIYPGHLIILRPEALRLELVTRFLGLAYRYRNWPLRRRIGPLFRRSLGMLLAEDWRGLRRGRFPLLTVSVPWHLFQAYRGSRRGTLTISELETHLARAAIHRRYRRTARPLTITLTDITAFAKDIDTWQELHEAVAMQSESDV